MVWWCLSQNDATKKKSKDRERRKSLIQAITGLFSNKKDEPKEAESSPTKKAKETAKSPSLKDKFPLLKLSPKKDKFKSSTSTDSKLNEVDGRVRSFSSPVSPTSVSPTAGTYRFRTITNFWMFLVKEKEEKDAVGTLD